MRPLTLLALAALAACRSPAAGDSPAPTSSVSASSAAAPPASASSGDACDGGLGYGASCDGKGTGRGVLGKVRDPKALRAEASLVGTTSGLPGEVVIRIVRANLPLLRRCASAMGNARVAFEIDAAGKAAKVRDAGSTLGADVAGCMVRVIEGLSFPSPERAPVTATVEVTISPP